MSFLLPPAIDIPYVGLATAAADSAPALATASPGAATLWTSVPVILKVSDAVAAGAPLTINGEGINATTVDVALALDTTGSASATPPVSALHPQILQFDIGNQFVVCAMPAGAAAGVYNVWVKNEYGWSSVSKMNAARALYMSDYQAYTGLNIEVTGRNFDQSEFGGTTATQVHFNNGIGGIYGQAIVNLNPYNVTFTVGGGAPVGTYYVEVSNDGGHNWSRPSSGQTLTIVAKNANPDPYGLNTGVSWTQDFNWANVINVTASGGDDTTAINNALTTAGNNANGGIVLLHNGTFYASGTISLPNKVLLIGESEAGTILTYKGGGGWSFIRSTSGATADLQGLARLSIRLAVDMIRPDVIVNLGGGGSDQSQWTAKRLLIDHVDMNYGLTAGFSSASYDVNDTDAGITYTGTSWQTVGNLHSTTHVGDYFQYTFTGSGIGYHTGQTGGAH
ncbi:MAG: glycosyl hydrolase family 28-related protein, partial [Phycisphaerae bacterium]